MEPDDRDILDEIQRALNRRLPKEFRRDIDDVVTETRDRHPAGRWIKLRHADRPPRFGEPLK
ncbi:hypothetical protein [uncultured Thiocystis sp.]|uniref:hypothetical protein n=1 Tax=uncultured Thiocystis sp. TaxID=1202134 RepID=UPI0025D2FD89|nr:hypothetical protein [uncultured Thiocystis sp.]